MPDDDRAIKNAFRLGCMVISYPEFLALIIRDDKLTDDEKRALERFSHRLELHVEFFDVEFPVTLPTDVDEARVACAKVSDATYLKTRTDSIHQTILVQFGDRAASMFLLGNKLTAYLLEKSRPAFGDDQETNASKLREAILEQAARADVSEEQVSKALEADAETTPEVLLSIVFDEAVEDDEEPPEPEPPEPEPEEEVEKDEEPQRSIQFYAIMIGVLLICLIPAIVLIWTASADYQVYASYGLFSAFFAVATFGILRSTGTVKSTGYQFGGGAAMFIVVLGIFFSIGVDSRTSLSGTVLLDGITLSKGKVALIKVPSPKAAVIEKEHKGNFDFSDVPRKDEYTFEISIPGFKTVSKLIEYSDHIKIDVKSSELELDQPETPGPVPEDASVDKVPDPVPEVVQPGGMARVVPARHVRRLYRELGPGGPELPWQPDRGIPVQRGPSLAGKGQRAC